MRGKLDKYIVSILAVVIVLSTSSNALDLWQAPFDTSSAKVLSENQALSLDDILKLVAVNNPAFRSYDYQLRAAHNDLKQAGLWANPELDVEFGEVGWDAPGFQESEFSVSLAQEFEFFGQSGARKDVAWAQIDATKLQMKLSSFDLYLETKLRFYAFAHAQQNVILAQKSIELTKEIVENTSFRLEKGAALQSELLLAQLEEQRAQLALEQTKQDVIAEEATLVSLWKGKPSGMKVSVDMGPNFTLLLHRIAQMPNHADSARDLIHLQSELDILRAEKRLAITKARPSVTLSGGFKRLEMDKSKSFHFGFSMPLPFFSRNQGTKQSLDARVRSLEYDIELNQIESNSIIQSNIIQLKKSINSYVTIDSLLLPTAEKAYRTLQKAYEAGRVPFTQLLEAERALNDINFERNDILMAIQERIITLESITGVALFVTKEN
ncbi:MAG: TolC family protein [candidate division Zixibacteria bacterium]|nr:TolC family protein [candidate division Zixibacteria bacterium]